MQSNFLGRVETENGVFWEVGVVEKSEVCFWVFMEEWGTHKFGSGAFIDEIMDKTLVVIMLQQGI